MIIQVGYQYCSAFAKRKTLELRGHEREQDVEEEPLAKEEIGEDKVAAPELQTHCDAATS